MLYLQDGVSQSMRNDIESFDYTWLLELVSQLNWGKEVSNLLLVGMPDVVTPAHFDILENLYVQVSVVSWGPIPYRAGSVIGGRNNTGISPDPHDSKSCGYY